MLQYRVRLESTAEAVPETAGVRIVAALPIHWAVSQIEFTATSVTFALTVPDDTPSQAVTRVLDEALSQPALHGWSRAGR
jgi:hypothetical protein